MPDTDHFRAEFRTRVNLQVRILTFVASRRSARYVNPGHDRATRNTDTVVQAASKLPPGMVLSVFKRCRPIVHRRGCSRARRNRYKEPTSPHNHTDARRRDDGEFEARCASEFVFRIPKRSSERALTAPNPAAFSPSLATGVCRADTDEVNFKELPWKRDSTSGRRVILKRERARGRERRRDNADCERLLCFI